MWLLHIRSNHVRGCDVERTVRTRGRRSERIHERKHLQVRRVSKHCGGNSERAAGPCEGEANMKLFELSRADDADQAIGAGARAGTAQQGADIRFIAGGTTLIDLMKLNVEQPQNLVDVNRLPLDKIAATPDGGLTIGAMVRNSDLAWHPL